MLETFTHDFFAGRVGEAFPLRFPDGELPLSLIGTGTWSTGGTPPPSARTPFTLTFRGPRQPAVRQGVYNMEHAELGAFPIFLVPLGFDADGMRYEAVFS